MKVRFSEFAERDLELLLDNIALIDPVRARLANRAIRSLIHSIGAGPSLGSPVGDGMATRKKTLRPYCILYGVRSDEVLILPIVHERSDWASLV